VYEAVTKHSENDYITALSAEQKIILQGLQVSRLTGQILAAVREPYKNNEIGNMERMRAELYKIFLTDDPEYAQTREKLKKEGGAAANAVIAILSAAVAANFGVAAAACVPFVVYFIISILKAGFAATLESIGKEADTEV
jgi:hypothetical protein